MTALAIDTSNPPFLPAIETVLDVPVPPSVNETRKVNWPGHRKMKAWRLQASKHLLANGQWRGRLREIERYQLTIILSDELCRLDPDNIKAVSDFLKDINVIVDDGPKHARRIVIEWGEAPSGCRLIVTPLEAGRDGK